MGHRPLLAGIIAGIFWLTPALAEVKAITAVSRTLPAPSTIILPELPALAPTYLAPVSLDTTAPRGSTIQPKAHLDLSAFGLPCGAVITNRIASPSSYAIRISAPCRPHETVSFTVNGLRFDMELSMTGETAFDLPAVANSAVLDTVFEDGEHHVTALPDLDISKTARIGMSWTGAGAPRFVSNRLHVTTLGDGPSKLQILSSEMVSDRSETIRLTLRRYITESSCDRPATGHVFRQIGDGPALRYDISLAPVTCDRIGETLELKNILEDLKLATN